MTNDLTTTSILALFETSKEERKSFVSDLIQRIESGDVNPLNVHLQVKCMEDIISQLTDKKKYEATAKKYNEALLAEAGKYGKKFTYHNATIEQKEVGTKYDWSKCEDQSLNELLAQAETLKSKIEERQAFLKTISQSGLVITDEETGETTKVYPPSKSSTTSLAVSLK